MRTSTKSGKLLPHFHENPTFERDEQESTLPALCSPRFRQEAQGSDRDVGGEGQFSALVHSRGSALGPRAVRGLCIITPALGLSFPRDLGATPYAAYPA